MNKIIINTPEGSSVKMNASKIHMSNVDEQSTGGEISHNSQDLTQVGGSQTARGGGKITNRVENGTLRQENVDQLAEDKGEITNEVKKN